MVQFFLGSGLAYQSGRGRKFSALIKPYLSLEFLSGLKDRMQGFQPGGLVQFFLVSGLAYKAGRGRKFSALTTSPDGLSNLSVEFF